VILSDPTLPTTVTAKPLLHPNGAALDELFVALDHPCGRRAQLESKPREYRCVRFGRSSYLDICHTALVLLRVGRRTWRRSVPSAVADGSLRIGDPPATAGGTDLLQVR